jgi:hypothetical protein
MRYLWRETIRLDNSTLRRFLGDEPRTPIDVAVTATLESLGCVPKVHSVIGRVSVSHLVGGGQ